MVSGRGPKKSLIHLIQNTSFGVGDSELFKWYTLPHGAQGRAPIAFLIDDIPLGAPQVAYVNLGER